MGSDYAADIRKYTNKVDDKAVASIVKFCGIALRGADSQWVSVTDDAEVQRVVKGFCAKKLDLDAKTAEAAVKAVGEKMKADRPSIASRSITWWPSIPGPSASSPDFPCVRPKSRG